MRQLVMGTLPVLLAMAQVVRRKEITARLVYAYMDGRAEAGRQPVLVAVTAVGHAQE